MKQNCKTQSGEWWRCVQLLTKMIHTGEVSIANESAMIDILKNEGLKEHQIDKVFDWIEMAQNSDCFFEVYNMLVKPRGKSRPLSMLESLSIPKEIFAKIQKFREAGYLSDEHAERIIEGLRTSDTRDWDEVDINNFYNDIINSIVSDDCKRMIISATGLDKNSKKSYH